MRYGTRFVFVLGISLVFLFPVTETFAYEVVQNGTFETGDFTSWQLAGQTFDNGQGSGNWWQAWPRHSSLSI